ncbi:uncharacterized protein TRAVEDRAFT_28302, partial [Trametes versicolor FP-101664 SS1]|uniref:uncharacterized protein n=1 Tax=Trametes versicolor (strain FP-101664) TaxID=717944 RepID=UPI0004622420
MSTTSATHRFPPTVLQEICRELLCLPLDQTDQGFRHIGSRTVAALAVTARLFLEPAMNVLWHTIPDIAVLFFTLDEEAYHQGEVFEGERQLQFKGTPSESQLERFFAYARRVRAVYSAAHVSTRVRFINA